MAAPCANVVWEGGPVCGAKKIAPVHSVHHPEYHKYYDKTPSDLGMSEGRRNYLASQKHQESYDAAKVEPGCLGHMAGAPGECSGPLTPHHTAGRGASGGQKASERDFPVVMLCQWLNGAIESDPAVRRWAERTTFERDGVEYPFRISARVARALKAVKP